MAAERPRLRWPTELPCRFAGRRVHAFVVRSFAPSMLAGRRVHGQALGASLPALPELRRFDGLLAVTERPCRRTPCGRHEFARSGFVFRFRR